MHSEVGTLRIQGGWFSYGPEPVVRDVSLSLRPTEMVALAGPNGSGKTTLLKLLTGARAPQRGEVTLDGRAVTDLAPRRRARHIAVVPQHVEASLMFTVEQMVGMGRAPYIGLLGAPSGADRAAVANALQATDLLPLAGRRFGELSGGEQQRVALAMALAQESRFMLLDEPTVHLDLHHQHELLELLCGLHLRRGVGIIAVMHDLNLAALYFSRLAVMEQGRLIADGATVETMIHPDVLSVFRAPLSIVSHPQMHVPQVLLRRSEG